MSAHHLSPRGPVSGGTASVQCEHVEHWGWKWWQKGPPAPTSWWAQFQILVLLVERLAEMPSQERESVLDDPWRFRAECFAVQDAEGHGGCRAAPPGRPPPRRARAAPTVFERFVTSALGGALARHGVRCAAQEQHHRLDLAGHVQIRPDLVLYRAGRTVSVVDAAQPPEALLTAVLALADRIGNDEELTGRQ
ncbi:hypothetical protein AB0I54_29405 [Streptomyces sp. NPDC050625]|uniref:hypothetical protein n=1 Tax=Streptomyces sp. NPDC050625 TaxID=3154629 RepID=UPI0034166C0B